MNDDTISNPDQLDALIAACIRAEEAGESIDRDKLLADYPELADELQTFFTDRDRFRKLASGMKAGGRRRPFVPPTVRYFGDYELLEEIARGGMGVVYKARQTTLNRIVAVKMILSGHLAEEDDVKRFQAEAQAAASLRHPGIVAVHEVGTHHGQHYFSMDYIAGPSLPDVIRDDPLPAPRAAAYVQAISEAVHYAHQQGILHRDLKPSNVLLDSADQIHVTDFGLARRLESDCELTRSGQILGTPSYLPPEQAEGKRALIGPASDIYSLGAILYELLTRRPPFQSDSPVETVRQVLETEPLSPRLLNPAVPRDLETICLKCLEKEPHKRYITARHLAEDLRRFLAGEPILARPTRLPARVWRWCKRRPSMACMIGLTTVALLTLLAGLSISNSLIRKALGDRTQAVTDLKEQQRVTEAALSAKAQAVERNVQLIAQREAALAREASGRKKAEATAYHSLVREAHALRLARKPGYRHEAWARLQQALAIDTPEKDLDRLRQEAVACMGDFVGIDPTVWNNDARSKGLLAVFPDSRRFAMARNDRSVSIRMIENNQEISRLRTSIGIYDLTVAPDGRHLVIADGRQATEVWSEDDSGSWERVDRHDPILARPEQYVTRVRFFPDGRRFAVSSFQSRAITILGLADRDLDEVIRGPKQETMGMFAVSPDGRLLASALNGTSVGIWDVEAQRWERTIQTPMNLVLDVAFSPDGRHLVVGADDGFVTYDAQNWSQWSLVRLDASFSLSFSPNSSLMAFGTMSKTVGLWSMSAQREIAFLDRPDGAGSYDTVGITPDGQWLLSAGGSAIHVWRLRGLPEIETFRGHLEAVPRVAFSFDGKLLASGSKDKTAKVWDVETGKLLHTLRVEGIVQSVAFSPDGRTLAIGEYNPTATLTLWDLPTETRLAAERMGRPYLYHVAFTSDGKTLISLGYGMSVFDVDTQVDASGGAAAQLVLRNHVDGEKSLFAAISSNDEWIAWVDRWKSIRLWNLKEHREQPFSSRARLLLGWHNISYLPDDRHVVFIAANGKPQVWDTATGKIAYELSNTRDFELWNHDVSPDGRYLAVKGRMGALTIVDLHSRQELFTLGALRSPAKSVCWSPDGRRIALGLADGGAALWDFASIREQLTDIGLGWQSEGDLSWAASPAN